MTSFDYIQTHFFTLDQVAHRSGVSLDRLEELQKAGCLPGPAYRLEGQCRINSIFGDHTEMVAQDYYPSSHVEKAKALVALDGSLEKIAGLEETAFRAEYKRMLVELDACSFGLASLFDTEGNVAGEMAEELLTKEWQHYLDGTYGLCTKRATAKEIAIKEIMIARIKFLTDEGRREASSVNLQALAEAVDALDEVSAPFAPHEVGRSSRQTYINEVREKYLSG